MGNGTRVPSHKELQEQVFSLQQRAMDAESALGRTVLERDKLQKKIKVLDKNPLAESWFQKYLKLDEVLVHRRQQAWEIEDILAEALKITRQPQDPVYGEGNDSLELAKKAAARVAELEIVKDS